MERPSSAADSSPRPPVAVGRAGLRAAAAVAAGLAVAGVAAACSSIEIGGGTGPTKTAEMELDIRVPGSTSSSSVRPGLSISQSVAISDSVTVDSADFVIRELQVGKEGTECTFGAPSSGTGGDDGLECEEFSIGTIIRTLPVDGSTDRVTVIGLEPATWDHLAFQFNVLTRDNQEDLQVIGTRGDMVGASVFIRTLVERSSGLDTVDLRLDPEGERVVSAPESITLEGQEGGVATLFVDVASWFDDGNGATLDPADVADQAALREDVKANIDASFSLDLSAAN